MRRSLVVTIFASAFAFGCSSSSGSGDPTTDPPADAGVDTATGPDSGTDASSDGATEAATDVAPEAGVPRFVSDPTGLTPDQVAVLVNSDDPQSVAVGAYYAKQRKIPAANVISLALGAKWATGKTTTVDAPTFTGWKTKIDAAVPATVQAYAVTWIYPSVVQCMGITSALAFGFDAKWCSTPGGGCTGTAPSPYFDSTSATPFTTHAMRPAMVLASVDEAGAKALIDRGLAADATFPLARGYLLRTSDAARSTRYSDMVSVNTKWNKPNSLAFTYTDNSAGASVDSIKDKTDVLFYFTGLASVPDITTNKYLPGAVADHLTSYGGQIPTSGQMSILRWLEAGATASFGTVVEPCNYTAKFPQVSVFVKHYFAGETLIEAYWKSVHWPGEGLFIGDPLARPYGTSWSVDAGTLHVKTTTLKPATAYRLERATDDKGPWTTVKTDLQATNPELVQIDVPTAAPGVYRLVTP